MSGKTAILKDYEYLLQRLYLKAPSPASSGERFQLPKPDVVKVGNETVFRNLKEFAYLMKREPQLLVRYLLRELGVSGTYDEESGILKIGTTVSAQGLYALMERFAKQYVICPTCGRPDTRLEKRGRIFFMKCDACGAEQSMKAF
ncbi:MAG: translation initiation factor IF-2 subunit beta [Fervidicoccaceae archaeon]